MASDLTHAIRRLASYPGWTLVAAASLALGIGINTTAFSIADALFLRPLPVADPARLVSVRALAQDGDDRGFFFLEYRDLAANAPAFSGVTAVSSRGGMLHRGDESELIPVEVVDGNFFQVLGVQAQLGRTLQPATDSSPDGAPNVVLSHSMWQRRFGGDASIVGRQIQLNDSFVTVTGVLPASFSGLRRGITEDLYVSPAAWSLATNARSDIDARQSRQFEVIARLAPTAALPQALSQVEAVGRRLAASYPKSNRDLRFTASLMERDQRRDAVAPVTMMLAIVALVLWIACGNVAGLQLAQAEARRREIGIRQALGASRARLIRQMLVESALLSALGAAAGLVLAQWLLGALPVLLPAGPLPVDYGLRLDARVYLFTLAVTLAAVLLSGLAPALRASKTDMVPAIKGAETGRPGRRLVMRRAVVAGQVALAVVLLNTAGLLLRSFLHTRDTSPGFDPARNLACVFMHTGRTARGAEVTAMYDRLREEAAALPGVRRVTYARRLPLFASGGGATLTVEMPALNLPEEQRRPGIHYDEIGPGYLETVGTRLLRGRTFGTQDTAQAPPVVMVSQAFVQRYFADRDPLDQAVLVRGRPARIVGVTEDARMNSIHEVAQPFLYVPFAQMPSGEATLLIESLRDPAPLAQQGRQIVHRVYPQAVVLSTVTMRDHMKEALFMDWVQAVLSAGLAGLGVLLAAIGLFATVSYAVGRRIREFGIRMALGARRGNVFSLVVKQSLGLTATGIAAGSAGSYAVGKLLSGMLYGVAPGDLPTLAASALAALAVAVFASLAPARRAVRVDPMVALRYE